MNEDTACSFLIRNIAHKIICLQDKCLAHYGLTNQQARLLKEINILSKKKKMFGRKHLEKSLNLKGPSVTSLLHGLESKKLIESKSNLKDTRRKIFCPTDEGKKLIKHLELVFEATENQLTEQLTDKEVEQFKALLQIVCKNMSEE